MFALDLLVKSAILAANAELGPALEVVAAIAIAGIAVIFVAIKKG
jgi:hypothetical protein